MVMNDDYPLVLTNMVFTADRYNMAKCGVVFLWNRQLGDLAVTWRCQPELVIVFLTKDNKRPNYSKCNWDSHIWYKLVIIGIICVCIYIIIYILIYIYIHVYILYIYYTYYVYMVYRVVYVLFSSTFFFSGGFANRCEITHFQRFLRVWPGWHISRQDKVM